MYNQGKDPLIQKDPKNETAPNNYWPITCLPTMWKLLTARIKKEIFYSYINRELFPEKLMGYLKGGRRTTVYWSAHLQGEQN